MEQPDALVLTGIGIGTAFGVLVLLLAAVFVIRLINWLVGKWTGPGRRSYRRPAGPGDAEPRSRGVGGGNRAYSLPTSPRSS